MVIIIESPNKKEKINSFVKEAKIFATYGHFKELSSKEWLDLNTYEAEFEFKNEKLSNINNIIKSCTDEEVHIATDPDREGYAIGYFIYEIIKNKAKIVYRTEFREITQSGILKGINEKKLFKDTNLNNFESFKARAVADKLIGYTLSPELSNLLKQKALSVGRVQTPALALIVKREKDISIFNQLDEKEKIEFKINVKIKLDDDEITLNNDTKYPTEEEANIIVSKFNNHKTITCKDIDEKEEKKSFKKPLQTTTLIKEVNTKLKFQSNKTMSLAQNLYEKGLITYHRTDSEFMSLEFINELENHLKDKEWYSKKEYQAGTQSQAEAHEAIRITHYHNFSEIENMIKKESLTEEHKEVYTIIYLNTIFSQAKPIINVKTSYLFMLEDLEFKNEIKQTKYLSIFNDDEFKALKKENEIKNLLNINKDDIFEIKEFEIKKINKQAPVRYKEADFIPLLQKEGIGRPSTYAIFIPKLLEKKYIVIDEDNKITATDLGIKAVDTLDNSEFKWITDSTWTAELENTLDKIQQNQETYQNTIKRIHQKLNYKNFYQSNIKPTEKQIEFMQKIAALKNIQIPKEALEDIKICKDWIDKNNTKKPPTEKQIEFAKKLAAKKNIKLPKDLENDFKICSSFIDKHK